jgi:hypothetical protein
MLVKLKSLEEFKEMKSKLDAIKLMKAIESLSNQFEVQKYHPRALRQAKKRFYLFHQSKEMMNAKFLEAFQTIVYVITECRGEIGHAHERLRVCSERRVVPLI